MNFNLPEVARLLDEAARKYESVVRGVEAAATRSDRAYGGVVRSEKGKLVETIARNLARAAWIGTGRNAARLAFDLHPKYEIPITKEYVNSIPDSEIRAEILANIGEYKIRHGTDLHVYADREFALSVECKAFTENAMLKRILFDAHLLKTKHPNLRFALVQLESQLGGDYSQLPKTPHGSKSTHTLMSYMRDVDLRIITLLEGERKVDQPIHKAEFYKPLTAKSLRNAAMTLAKLLPD